MIFIITLSYLTGSGSTSSRLSITSECHSIDFPRITQNPIFDRKILSTDEDNFSKNRIRHSHNNQFWDEENPHTIVESHHREQSPLNVWAGIIGDYLFADLSSYEEFSLKSYKNYRLSGSV